MMTLYECEVGNTYKIVGFNTQNNALKDRFISFGITKDKMCQVIHHSIKRSAIAIIIGGVQIALRDSEAKAIKVQALNPPS